jgi:hypothetical protein
MHLYASSTYRGTMCHCCWQTCVDQLLPVLSVLQSATRNQADAAAAPLQEASVHLFKQSALSCMLCLHMARAKTLATPCQDEESTAAAMLLHDVAEVAGLIALHLSELFCSAAVLHSR